MPEGVGLGLRNMQGAEDLGVNIRLGPLSSSTAPI